MSILLLTLRDLGHRRLRFLVVTLLGAIVFALLFVMTGLVEQFEREPSDTVTAIGGRSWVVSDGVSGPFNGLSILPAGLADTIPVDGAAEIAPVVISRTGLTGPTVSNGDIVLIGVVPGGLGSPEVVAGRALDGADEVVLDRTAGPAVGDTVAVGGRELEVVGHTADTTLLAGAPLAFVTLPVAQDLTFSSELVVSALVADADIAEAPPGTIVLTADEVIEDTRRPLENAVASVDLVRALLWAMSAIIIGAVVYLSALERQRDFAVLKAVGASTPLLLASLAIQAVLIALTAVAVGAVIQLGLAPSFPLTVRVPDRAFWQVPVIAVAVALLASVVGLRRVAASDPLTAFGGAGG